MATQRDVQQLIQNLTPSGVNNGNPNTVYNTPMPTVDAQGRWTTPTVNPAASLPALNMDAVRAQLTPWQAPTGAPAIRGPILPQMPSMAPTGPGGNGTTPPPGGGTPPPVGPPVTPPGGGGGGGTKPGFPEDILDLAPDRRPTTTQTGPFGWGHDVRQPGFPVGGGSGGSGGGSFSWQQFLDMITEPLLPGDLYHSGTGEWDGSNAALAGLDALLGPGSSWLAEQGGSMTNADWYHDHLMDIANNQMALNEQEVGNATNERVSQDIQRILDEMFGGPNATTRPDRGGRHSAGATTIAEGAAAQNMVGDMQLQYFLNALKQQAQAAMNPRYRYER